MSSVDFRWMAPGHHQAPVGTAIWMLDRKDKIAPVNVKCEHRADGEIIDVLKFSEHGFVEVDEADPVEYDASVADVVGCRLAPADRAVKGSFDRGLYHVDARDDLGDVCQQPAGRPRVHLDDPRPVAGQAHLDVGDAAVDP